MKYMYALRGIAVLGMALWALRAFTADSTPVTLSLVEEKIVSDSEAIVPNECGPEPEYGVEYADQWFAYGDCSGDYGIVDAE